MARWFRLALKLTAAIAAFMVVPPWLSVYDTPVADP